MSVRDKSFGKEVLVRDQSLVERRESRCGMLVRDVGERREFWQVALKSVDYRLLLIVLIFLKFLSSLIGVTDGLILSLNNVKDLMREQKMSDAGTENSYLEY
jgi:hypothetical protein